MAKTYYTKYLLLTDCDNVGLASHLDKSFNTTDYMYLESTVEIVKTGLGLPFYRTAPTDYCLANNVTQSQVMETATGESVGQWWTRTPHSANMVEKFNTYGDFMESSVDAGNIMVCPATQLDTEVVEVQRVISDKIFDIQEVKDNKGKTLYHTISFGYFPKSYVGDELNRELDIRYCTGEVKPTGKKYTARMGLDGKIEYADEYEYFGKKYVRVQNKQYFNAKFKDGTPVKHNEYSWIAVEPITWKIINWDEMPKAINPNGTGKSTRMKVRSENGLFVLPFYTNNVDDNKTFWQNSTLRGYLNGLNVNNIVYNGNSQYSAPNGGDFSGEQNFLQEAGIGLIITMLQQRGSKSKTPQQEKAQDSGIISVKLDSRITDYLRKKYMDDPNSIM